MNLKTTAFVVLSSLIALAGCAAETDDATSTDDAVRVSRPEIKLAKNAREDSLPSQLFSALTKAATKDASLGIIAPAVSLGSPHLAFALSGTDGVGRAAVLRSVSCEQNIMRDPAFFRFNECRLTGFEADGSLPQTFQGASLAAKLYRVLEISQELEVVRGPHGETMDGPQTLSIQDGGESLACTTEHPAGLAVAQYHCKYTKAPAEGELGGKCGGFIGMPCNAGLRCIVLESAAADSFGTCNKLPSDGELGGKCGGFVGLPCKTGLRCKVATGASADSYGACVSR